MDKGKVIKNTICFVGSSKCAWFSSGNSLKQAARIASQRIRLFESHTASHSLFWKGENKTTSFTLSPCDPFFFISILLFLKR